MSKRGDNIHKRNDGRWEGRYQKGRKPDGSIRYGSVYAKSYREVKTKLSEIAKEIPKQKVTRFSEKTFGDVLELWMRNNVIRLKGATINKYRNLIDTHIMPELGSVKLGDITSSVINNYLTQKLQNGRIDKRGGLSASYVRSIMLIVNAAIKFAVAAEQMCLPLKTPIMKPTNSKKEITFLSVDEQKRLETHICNNLDPTKAGVYITLHTGLRIGEICALAWDDVDFKNRLIKIRHTVARVRAFDREKEAATKLIIDTPKTPASARDIPISSNLLPILEKIYDFSSSAYVISETSKFISPRTYEYRYHRFKENDSVFSVEEGKLLEKLIKNNKTALQENPENYTEICFETGKLYWYYYDYADGSQIAKAKSSVEWFQDVIDNAPDGYENIGMAKVYANIGIFYRDITTNITEANDKGKYKPLFENLTELMNSVATDESESEIVRLELIELTRGAIQQYATKFKVDGVTEKELIALYDSVVNAVNSIEPTAEKTEELKATTTSNLSDTKAAVELAYNTSKGGNE